jgi:Protein of unknown function (DUF2490)
MQKRFLLILLLLNTEISAQKKVANQSLYWIRYYNILSISKNWNWHNEIEDRRFFVNNNQHHFITHSRLHYKINPNTEIGFGLTYSLQSPQEPYSNSDLIIPEIRPVQEIQIVNPLTKRFSMLTRFRIDERFIHKNDGKVLLDNYDFNFRFRYRLQLNYKLNAEGAKFNTILKLGDEIMLNAGKNIIYNQFDQNRIFVGIEKGISKNLGISADYIHWFQQRASGNQFFKREIIRLTLNHKLKL